MTDVRIIDDITRSKTTDDVVLGIFLKLLRCECDGDAARQAIVGTASLISTLGVEIEDNGEAWFCRKVLQANEKLSIEGGSK